MHGLDSVPPLSGGVAHAMAIGAEVGVSRCRAAAVCPAVSTTDVAPDLGEVVHADRDVFLREVLARLWDQNLCRMPTTGHHAFESRSVLSAVKARRFAPPA